MKCWNKVTWIFNIYSNTEQFEFLLYSMIKEIYDLTFWRIHLMSYVPGCLLPENVSFGCGRKLMPPWDDGHLSKFTHKSVTVLEGNICSYITRELRIHSLKMCNLFATNLTDPRPSFPWFPHYSIDTLSWYAPVYAKGMPLIRRDSSFHKWS